MMTVHKIAGIDAKGYADYLASTIAQRRGDYYLGPESEPGLAQGRWHGKAAGILGLASEVDREALLRVWEGRDPNSRETLIRKSADGEHVAAVDCTFSAPKSVSVVWALSDLPHRTEIEDAQTRAVLVALDHIERHAELVRRRIEGSISHERADGLVVARFRHHTSRLPGGQTSVAVPDPQLHDHCVIANLALRCDDAHAMNGAWAAIDSRELFRIAAEAGAVYRAELAHQLKQMGYALHRQGRYFEINGVSEEVRRVFSARSNQIETSIADFVAKHGRQPSDKEVKRLVVQTRSAKASSEVPAFEEWGERAAEVGLDVTEVPRLRHNVATLETVESVTSEIIQELTDLESDRSITKSCAIVEERSVRIAVAEQCQGRVPGSDVDSVIDGVMESRALVRLAPDKFTTRAMINLERKVLIQACARSTSCDRTLAPSVVRAAIAGARVALSREQITAVYELCDSTGLGLLTAPAGSGKGEVLRVVAEARRLAGHHVIAVAAAGETAQRFGTDIGGGEARTIDSLLHQLATGRTLTPNSVIFVDEAALLETKRWARLLDATPDTPIVATGDDRQLSPIEAGGIWGMLEQRLGAAHLKQNYRAHESWARDAWTCLRQGAAPQMVKAFEEHGLIEIRSDRLAARMAAVERWNQERLEGLQQGRGIEQFLLLTDSSNLEVDALNQLAQSRRIAGGELGYEAINVVAQDAAGNYRSEEFHAGDRVQFEKRVKPMAGRRIENGSVGTVTDIETERNSVQVDLGNRIVTIDHDQLDVLRLGYAQHVYSAQGRTVDNSYIVLGGWQTDRERSYVGVSRSRIQSVVMTDYSSLGVAPGRREDALNALSEHFALSHRKEAALSLQERSGESPGSVRPLRRDEELTISRDNGPTHGLRL